MPFLIIPLALIPAFIIWWIYSQKNKTLTRSYEEKIAQMAATATTEATQKKHEFELQYSQISQELEFAKLQLNTKIDDYQELRKTHNTLEQELGTTKQDLAAAKEGLTHLHSTQELLARKESSLITLTAENTELRTRLEQERIQFEEQLSLLKNAKADLSKEFENVANRIFESKQQLFTQSSKSLLDTTLDPLKSQLTDFKKKVEDVYEKENAERARLAGQVLELQKQAQKIGEDAVNLAQALKGNSKTQGNWGEVVLERLLEESGLQKGREYETQLSFTDADGARRMPDVVIRLPEQKDIIIDSKVSLLAYEKFCSSEDEAEKLTQLNAHVASIRAHIKGLSLKDYEKLEGIRALDFVFIFIPIEAAFMLALQHDPSLYREAYDRHIVLVSPTTLLATLRTVENIWRYEKQNKNAERIAKEAGALHDQFVLLLESLDSVGGYLGKTQEAYNKARERLQTGRGNLVKRVDDLRKLGAKTKKGIDSKLLKTQGDLPEENLLEDLSPEENTDND